MRRRSLIIGNESTEESRKEISSRPGAPRPPAKAMIFCFQPVRPRDNARSPRQSYMYSRAADLFPRHPRKGISFTAIWTISLAETSIVLLQRQAHRARLLRKRGAGEVVHENLHQWGPVKIRP